MKIAERILLLLNEPRTTKEIQSLIPDKSARCLAATISNNPNLFLRLEKGLVGLKGRDEHLVTNKRIYSTYALYKRIVNLLVSGPLELRRIYALLEEEKEVSIRATICMRKDLFIVAGIRYNRMVGRKGRDEWIIEKYPYRTKKKVKKEKEIVLTDLLETILSDSSKTLEQICSLLPHVKRKSITCKLSLHKKFVNCNGIWTVTGNLRSLSTKVDNSV